MERRFRAAGLRIGHDRFHTPRGRSRNVIGIRDAPGDCLRVFMAHSDSAPPAPGANDNASGLGALVALAEATIHPRCDVWLVATGAEERVYTGSPDHLGALALARRLRARRGDVQFGLSLDEVGRGPTFWVRSPAAAPRRRVERRVPFRWVRDSGSGNSDHRELELAGIPAMKLGISDDPCRHTACDRPGRLRRAAFRRVLRAVLPLATG